MNFMIFDETGNALSAFDQDEEARACFQQLVREDPSLVRSLTLLTFDDAGNAVGEAEVAADMPLIADFAISIDLTEPPSHWSRLGARTFVGRWAGTEIRNTPSLNGVVSVPQSAPGVA
jgi:hypothetical protein